MKKRIISASSALFLLLANYTAAQQSIIPPSTKLEFDDSYTIIWNGISKAYRYENEQWVRAETYDYQFDVIQKRYDNQWKSVKSLHRIHPDYDGKAGERDQTMYFEVLYKSLQDAKVQSVIQSSIGNGTGTSDVEFRVSELTMYVPKPSKFLPYNKFRITQSYNYEEGKLTETVELILEKDGTEKPFMKNEETALIFLQTKLDKAPTSFKQ
ncbi:hypothetical protein [Fluviicola sp.]|uniref:hypothetical protein n=1 Tax=Fluviicola sp. TaxID=1917219 RepID=UPI003D2CABAA